MGKQMIGCHGKHPAGRQSAGANHNCGFFFEAVYAFFGFWKIAGEDLVEHSWMVQVLIGGTGLLHDMGDLRFSLL